MKSRQKIKSHSLKAELLPDQSTGLLKELHLLTPQGDLNADARRKLKQVNHLINLIRPAMEDLMSRHDNINVVDMGAGKSYLGFILNEVFFKNSGKGTVISIEEREELVKKSEVSAAKLGFTNMKFISGKISESGVELVHLLTALHACDTATDDAIISALDANADYIALVPCCQAEVAEQLKKSLASTEIGELWAHGIHRREFGSQLTNVIRALFLESKGYQVTVTELIGWEHSLKNEFILAKKINRENLKAKSRLESLLKLIPITPKLLRHFAQT